MQLDGTDHEVSARCFCHPRRCPQCGGRVHRQAIYGPAFMYQCEGCDYTPNPEMDYESLPRAAVIGGRAQ